MDNGWIKLHRKMVEWEWYHDPIVFKVFMHLLLTVNYEDKKWKGILVNKGQIVTSYCHLSEQIGYSIHQIRLALDKLKKSQNVAIKTTNKYTVITMLNWELYQQKEEKRQTNGKQTATTKEVKKEKKDTPAIAGSDSLKKNMKTFNYDTGDYEEETKSIGKNKEAIRLALMFDKLASDYSGKPIITPKSYFIVLNAMNKHKMKPKGIEMLYTDWFDNPKILLENKVKLTWCLGKDNINSFKVKN